MSFTIAVKNSVAFIYIDTLNSQVNYVDETTLDGIPNLLKQLKMLATDTNINYLILCSTKLHSFMTTVKLSIVQENCASSVAMSRISKTLQLLANSIESFPKPVIAVINGECISFGLELALACKYRIAINSLRCNFGFPDVEWGLCPAAGGCRRLALTVTPEMALDLLLSGKSIDADEAYRIGLVHKLLKENQFEIQSVENLCIEFIETEKRTKLNSERRKLINSFLSADSAKIFISFKWNLFLRRREELMCKCKFIYAAPGAILSLVEHAVNYKEGSEKILAYDLIERTCFAGLASNRRTQPLLNLQQVKFQQMLNYSQNDGLNYIVLLLGEDRDTFTSFLRNNLKFKSSVSCFPTIGLQKANFEDKYNIIQLTQYVDDPLVNSLLDKPILIVENSSDDLLIKSKWRKRFESINNSTYLKVYTSVNCSLSDEDNENILKVRMYNYIKNFKVLEVLVSNRISSQLIDTIVKIGSNFGNLVVTVNNNSGYVFRILMAMVLEVLNIIVEGANPLKVQKWLIQFGYESEVLILLDYIGIDVIHRELTSFAKIYHPRFQCDKVLRFLENMIVHGFLGIKSQIGFYCNNKIINKQVLQILKDNTWKSSTKLAFSKGIVQWRVTCKLANEAITCLQENVIDSILIADAAAVYAIGFPPASGGPFKWVDINGAANIIKKLIEFDEVPNNLLCEKSNTDKTFYL